MPKSVEELFDGSAFDVVPDAPPQEQQAPEAQAAPAETQEVPAKAEPPAPEAQPAQAAAGQEQGAPPAPEDHDGRDPAFGRLRKERNDYREQRDAEKLERVRAEERLAAQTKALEAAQAEMQQLRQMAMRAAPPQQAPAQQQRIPNPVEDPAGYAQFVRQQAVDEAAGPIFQRFLFQAEAMAERNYGKEVVAATRQWFDREVKGKPLHQEILSQPDPWDAAVQAYQRSQLMAEIGSDPAAYRAKIEAEALAKVQAQLAAEQTPAAVPTRQTAAPNLPPSLGKVPNAGARSTAYTGPAPIEALWG